MLDIIENVAVGVSLGILVGVSGYLKNVGEKFKSRKLMKTVAVGAVVGGIASVLNVSYSQAEAWLATAGVIVVVENVVKSVWRRWRGKDG